MQSQTASTARKSYVQPGIANALQSICVRGRTSLLLWFRRSTLRVVVLEIRCFPLRMIACVTTPFLRHGTTIYAANRDRSMGSFDEERKYQRACTLHIQELQGNHPWVGPLDLEIVAQAHRQGALWVRDNYGIGIESTEQIQPSETPRNLNRFPELRNYRPLAVDN